MLTKIVGDKPKLLILNKADLADPAITKEWRQYLNHKEFRLWLSNSKEQVTVKVVTDAAKKLMVDKIARQKERGIKIEPCVPWLSVFQTLVNQRLWTVWLVRKLPLSAIKPGVTKGQQWLKTNKDLEILDTPGILWPKFEDETVALKLALTGAIKDQLLPMDEVTIFGLNYFKEHYPEKLAERFKQNEIEEEAPVIIMDMTRALGFRDDYDRFYSLFVKEVRDGKLGNYTLDTLEDLDGDD